jgi:hypothetical protein
MPSGRRQAECSERVEVTHPRSAGGADVTHHFVVVHSDGLAGASRPVKPDSQFVLAWPDREVSCLVVTKGADANSVDQDLVTTGPMGPPRGHSRDSHRRSRLGPKVNVFCRTLHIRSLPTTPPRPYCPICAGRVAGRGSSGRERNDGSARRSNRCRPEVPHRTSVPIWMSGEGLGGSRRGRLQLNGCSCPATDRVPRHGGRLGGLPEGGKCLSWSWLLMVAVVNRAARGLAGRRRRGG